MIVGDLERRYPSAAACLADDLPALCIHLRYLPRLRKRFRLTNLLERSLEEVRRGTKVVGRFPGQSSCLSSCWAVLDLVVDAAHSGPCTGAGGSCLAVSTVETSVVAAVRRMERSYGVPIRGCRIEFSPWEKPPV